MGKLTIRSAQVGGFDKETHYPHICSSYAQKPFQPLLLKQITAKVSQEYLYVGAVLGLPICSSRMIVYHSVGQKDKNAPSW